MPLDRTMEAEDVADKKEPVKGGGICIYCGWDGGAEGLRNEHTVPYSLGGNTELLAASCADCEAITSYLDGYAFGCCLGLHGLAVNDGASRSNGRTQRKGALPVLVLPVTDPGKRLAEFGQRHRRPAFRLEHMDTR